MHLVDNYPLQCTNIWITTRFEISWCFYNPGCLYSQGGYYTHVDPIIKSYTSPWWTTNHCNVPGYGLWRGLQYLKVFILLDVYIAREAILHTCIPIIRSYRCNCWKTNHCNVPTYGLQPGLQYLDVFILLDVYIARGYILHMWTLL